MKSSTNAEEVAAALLGHHGLRLQTVTTIQSLWAGYGQICRVTATENDKAANLQKSRSYILKLITPPPTKANDEGHTRKILSYQVEQYFYSHLAPQLPLSLPVAQYLGSTNEHHADGTSTTAMMLSDLKQQFPVAGEKRNVLSSTQVHAALDWLSGFHGFWWQRVESLDRSSLVLPPLEEVRHDGQDATQKSVWLNGGYTYLATRRKEYADLAGDADSEWSATLTQEMGTGNESISEIVATFLAPAASGSSRTARYETLIHGDVKSENLFTSESGEQVAFYDFQYIGLGLGVCDLAKLFTCSVPLNMLINKRIVPHELSMQDGERALLERYWMRLKDMGKKDYPWETFMMHWEAAIVDWLRFQASWGFWGNTEWLEARARSILKDSGWREALTMNTDESR
ncbi:hypothetical protein HBH69_193880 [Parastagonospora nodorum]|nr:hypothetical protein HBH69_193880 [Parastagonospora nodorum]KAH5188813.1 hypothetical protein HBH68_159610 [Parastagonospora nodorum]KAH5317793.1 hypothetical protein HBI12_116940 [Parastagonospora nodorum]KAH6090932.1 hypothetical protein HBI65_163240 [Parastagonospora nodorum]KAH6435506.1 hypothetical protein HBI59_167640 [Parastagonospora nodorum]